MSDTYPRNVANLGDFSYNIISFDGGGVRGVYSARLLQRLNERFPKLLASVALYAGTSTGGIIALGLAAGLPIAELVGLYQHHAQSIFRRRLFGGLWGAKYSPRYLHSILMEVHGEQTLRQLNTPVVIPTYDLDACARSERPRAGKPKFFESVDDGKARVVDVAMATSAAPTFFPAYRGYIDGGVVANNPAACAATQARLWGIPTTRIRVLSIGTGLSPTYIEGSENDWGIVQWAPKVPGLLVDGPAGVTHTLCAELLGQKYHRLDGTLHRPISLDDASAVEPLISMADQVDIEPTVRWLQETW